MSEEPEQMLPQQRRTTLVAHDLTVHYDQRDIEAGAQIAIEQQQNTSGEQNTESEQPENRRNKPCPNSERQTHHGHALGSQVQRSGDEVQRSHQRRDAE